MTFRRLAILLFLWPVWSCGSGDGVGPVPQIETGDLDPRVRSLLGDLVRAAEKERDSAEARGRLGLAYDVNAFPAAALAAFEQASALDSTDARWTYHAARLRAAGGDVEHALREIDTAIRLQPAYAPAHWRRGKWLLDLGRLDEAEVSLRECVRLEPDEPVARIALARVHVQQGRTHEALGLLEPIARATPGDLHVEQLLAAAYRQTGDLERAGAALSRARDEKKRDRPDPWRDEGRPFRVGFAAELERGIALLDRGRFAEGIEVLERIRPDRPDDVSLLSNLGAAYCATGKYRLGTEALEAALRIRPGHFPSLQNLIGALEAINRTADALAWANTAVETNPELGAAHGKRAEILVRLGRSTEALESFDAAHRLGHRSASSLYTSGRLKGQAGRWPDAAVDLRGALALDPGLGPARLLLARSLAEAGDLTGAREQLAIASAAAPGSAQVARVQQRLREIEGGAP